MTLPIRLHPKGAEALQYGEREANIDTASNVASTIGRRLSIHKIREKAHEPNSLRIGHKKMYAIVATRLDLSYVVGLTNCYMCKPEWKQWELVKDIFCYLRGIEDLQLIFRLDKQTEVEDFTDSYYAANPDNQKSMSRYIFTYGVGAISWRSTLQDFMALLTTEAKYIVTSEAAKKAIWMH